MSRNHEHLEPAGVPLLTIQTIVAEGRGEKGNSGECAANKQNKPRQRLAYI